MKHKRPALSIAQSRTGLILSRTGLAFSRMGLAGRLALGLGLGFAAVLAGQPSEPAAAQALGNHDVNAPVNFSADRIEVQDRADRVIIAGNVIVVQAGMQLNADRMTIAYTQAGGTQVNRIDATGGVTVKRDDQTARGDVAVYDLNRKLVTMLGNVKLTQGSNVLNGGRLMIDLTTGRATVDGEGGTSAPQRGPTGTVIPGSGHGRVSGSFTVPQKGK